MHIHSPRGQSFYFANRCSSIRPPEAAIAQRVAPVPRALVLPHPLQHLQASALATTPRVPRCPRAPVVLRPSQPKVLDLERHRPPESPRRSSLATTTASHCLPTRASGARGVGPSRSSSASFKQSETLNTTLNPSPLHCLYKMTVNSGSTPT